MILAQGFQRFVLDLDGVVWTGERAVRGTPETIRALRDAGRRFAFVTNNSSQLPETYAKKLARMGAGGDPDEVVTSAQATARLLDEHIGELRGRTAFVIGGPGLLQAVREVGVVPVYGEDALNAAIVVVGLDMDLTYEKLRTATLAIRAGAKFVASNEDATIPAEGGQWPGAGAIVAALRTSTGVEPLIAGKPSTLMLDLACERLGGAAPLVVGDRVGTDIRAAEAAGWPSALVLTGATGVPELAAASSWPDFVLRSFADVLLDLPHPKLRGASGSDLPVVATLLHEGGLQAGNVRERVGRTVVAETARGTLLATAAWEPVDGVALLRSVATTAPARSKGAGTLVVAAALRSAVRAGMRTAYLATQTAEDFFRRCGFTTIDREDLPEAVASHPQIVRECATGAVMRLQLPAPEPEPIAATEPAPQTQIGGAGDAGAARGRNSGSRTIPATKPPTWAR